MGPSHFWNETTLLDVMVDSRPCDPRGFCLVLEGFFELFLSLLKEKVEKKNKKQSIIPSG